MLWNGRRLLHIDPRVAHPRCATVYTVYTHCFVPVPGMHTTRKTMSKATAATRTKPKPAATARKRGATAKAITKVAKKGKTPAAPKSKSGSKAPAAKRGPKHASKPAPTKMAAGTEAKDAPRKEKTIRDSFNMPAADYALIAALKKRALALQREAKKSELLRAGVRLLAALSDEALHLALAAVPAIKTGRPRKKHK